MEPVWGIKLDNDLFSNGKWMRNVYNCEWEEFYCECWLPRPLIWREIPSRIEFLNE